MAKFKPGESGNAAGRPPGTRNRASVLREQLLAQGDLTAIVKAVVEKARGGDTAAAGLLLDRVWPRLRPAAQATTLELPDGTLVEKGEAVVRAISSGEVPPDVGMDLLNALGAVARLTETTELEVRLAALEAKLLEKKP